MSANLPWYKWYHRDWLLSQARFDMNLAERGLYRECLDLHHLEGSIPADPSALCRRLAIEESEFNEAWPKVSEYFVPHRTNQKHLVNIRAVNELHKVNTYRATQAQIAKDAAAKRKEVKEIDPRASLRLPSGYPQGSLRQSESESESESESDKSIGFPIGKPPPNGSPKAPDWGPQFDAWWAIWPRKVGKEDALKAYGQNIGDIGERHRTLMANTALWEQREFGVRESSTVPYPAHFLRRGDWKDPPPEAKPSSVVSVADRLQRIAKQ